MNGNCASRQRMTLCIRMKEEGGRRKKKGLASLSSFILHPSSFPSLHPHALEDRYVSWVRLAAVDVVAAEADVDVVINRDDRHLRVDEVLGLAQQRDPLGRVGLLSRAEAQIVEFLVLPIRIVLEAVGKILVGKGRGVGIIAVPRDGRNDVIL